MFRSFLACLTVGATVLGLPARAEDEALALMRKSDVQHRLPQERVRSRLMLQDQGGAQRVRQVEFITQDPEGRGDRLRVRFLQPADVKGTTLLSLQAPDEEGQDDQWLYLPSFRKTRRVGQAELGDRFVGTDFFFEDLKRREVEDYSYRLLGSEKVDGQDCHLIEAVPSAPKVVKESPYGKTHVWLRKDNLFAVRVRSFDKKLQPLKEIRMSQVRQVSGSAWRADETTVIDVQRKHRTVLTVEQRQTDFALSAETFSQHAMNVE
ncbi:outer membrane lipoprotein-sorting protein [Archangium lipolyticum]|uniref:outer membrane lipoprotein-sorting protein n=1 Tax=Archangium lipolyticum TaxID=2970465 RepID=UPI00214BCD47|nr:outer membrane lipoprotein-sorting protein [Archangium lipolyticum]